MDKIKITRGDIFYADLSPYLGSEQGGPRPVVVLQNDIGNRYSPTVIVSAITSQVKSELPTHVKIHSSERYGLEKNSVVMLEQVRTLDVKYRISKHGKIGHMNKEDMDRIDQALKVSLGLQ